MSNLDLDNNKSRISIQKIINNPFSIQSSFITNDGEAVIFRPLVRDDSVSFGIFLDSLSEETRKKFGPHPINSEEAKNICNNLNYAEMLRLVVVNLNKEIVGYVILSFLLRKSQVVRYKNYGIHLAPGKDACIAPVIADRYQNKGIGTKMLLKTLELARALGLRIIILWQGTQVSNTRAIHTYEKLGFKKNAEFERYGTVNCDMYLEL